MLAVIPARGGSKGVPNKNVKELSGKPLIAYTIEAALKSELFERVIVSTDSERIAEVARANGAEVPFIRPTELAGDYVSSDEVVKHAIEFYREKGEEFEKVCKLQPTSPLRNQVHIREAYQLFQEKKADFVVSVCECEHSPLWTGQLGMDLSMDDFIKEEIKMSCRQKLSTFYRLNGAIYMAKIEAFMREQSFFGKNGYAYVMEQEQSIDIDSELDFKIAEVLLRR
ncbi:MAG: pseudaminic acid cytidylyltransferase [Lachnospiraceae bacterium]|nr:pseudaminic acid cytidylyltransferase [Lachnospiraceae bacterium]MBQ3602107.1 pseudaminic acid cytidylyltransferase [Lachnospiraceae bacterium]